VEEKELLGVAGALEAWRFGRRIAGRYRELLSDDNGDFGAYNPNLFKMRSTTASRAGQTLTSFTAGFFSPLNADVSNGSIPSHCRMGIPMAVKTLPMIWDYELAPKDACPRWTTEVGLNLTTTSQLTLWDETHALTVTSSLSRRLQNLPLTPTDAKTIFKACGFDSTLSPTLPSGWCDLLRDEKEATELMEYLDDLEHWWLLAYGSRVNRWLGCMLLTDFVKEVRDGGRKGVLGFAHSDTMVFLVTALGLFEDPFEFTGDLSRELMARRRFRMADISPMLGNVVFEVFEDGRGHVSVRVMVNEVPTVIPGCGDMLCDVEQFVKVLGKKVGCDFAGLCGVVERGDDGESFWGNAKKARFVVQA
ncbi:PHOsphatase, partial [Dinochytrium kinnereticum]